MGYLWELHEAHKARLRRLAVAAPPGSGLPKAAMASMADELAANGKPNSWPERQRNPTIFEIKTQVAKNYGISTAALENVSLAVRYRIPRAVAIHLARRLTSETFDKIALLFLAIVTIRPRSMQTGRRPSAAGRILLSTLSCAPLGAS